MENRSLKYQNRFLFQWLRKHILIQIGWLFLVEKQEIGDFEHFWVTNWVTLVKLGKFSQFWTTFWDGTRKWTQNDFLGLKLEFLAIFGLNRTQLFKIHKCLDLTILDLITSLVKLKVFVAGLDQACLLHVLIDFLCLVPSIGTICLCFGVRCHCVTSYWA